MSKTMYMHTLEDRPASCQWVDERYDGKKRRVPHIYFVGGRYAATLVPTLRQLRREQDLARQHDNGSGEPWHYGYVLVRVED